MGFLFTEIRKDILPNLLVRTENVTYFSYHADIENLDYEFGELTTAEYFIKRAIINHNFGFSAKALIDINKSLSLNNKYHLALYQKSLITNDKIDFLEAFKALSDFIINNKKETDEFIYIKRGICSYQLQQYELAIADFNTAILINPTFTDALVNRGYVYYTLKNYKKALEDYSKVIDLGKDNLQALLFRGIIWFDLEKFEKAINDYERCLNSIRDGRIAFFSFIGLGRCYYQLKKYNDANNVFNKASEIDRHHWLPLNGMQKSIRALRNPENPPELNPKTDKRIALVIGNGEYLIDNNLKNLGEYPINDATDIVQTLQSVGFEQENIILKYNLTKTEFDSAFDSFIRAAKVMNADVAVLYFAGHGVEINGIHYWLPVDTTMQNFEQKLILVDSLIKEISKVGIKFKVGFSDACRNNPFYDDNGNLASEFTNRKIKISDYFIADERGRPTSSVPILNKESNVFIIYGTSSGDTASNMSTNGRNGLFTSILKSHIRRGEDIQLMVQTVGSKLKRLGQRMELRILPDEGFEW